MRIKRLLDVAGAAGGLLCFLPAMTLVSLAILLEDGLPLIFRQERLGERRRPFTILKFRSMRDGRITRVGRILRSTGLDELPQFINVLRDEMSVIGPRPERPYFVDQLERDIPYYALRFAAKPGLTGWAQVNYRYGASVDDAHTKLQYDLYYIQEMSPFLDLVILLKTFQTVLFRPGY